MIRSALLHRMTHSNIVGLLQRCSDTFAPGQEGCENIKGYQIHYCATTFNDIGRPAYDTVNINATACYAIFTPDAFSPNGDGLNDYFKPVLMQGQLILFFRIFDRWGKLIFNHSGNHSLG